MSTAAEERKTGRTHCSEENFVRVINRSDEQSCCFHKDRVVKKLEYRN